MTAEEKARLTWLNLVDASEWLKGVHPENMLDKGSRECLAEAKAAIGRAINSARSPEGATSDLGASRPKVAG